MDGSSVSSNNMMKVGSSSSSTSLKRKSCKSSLDEKDYNDVENTDLSEDVLFEIFVHLPLNSIFKFRCVSKLCFSLLSNPCFISKWRRINSYTPWMLINVDFVLVVHGLVSIKSLDLHSEFISDHDGFSFKFLSKKNPYRNPEIYPLASSNGLVLCSTSLQYQTRYYVCNPLTKEWMSLRRQPKNCHKWVLHGFICESSNSLTFTNLLKTKKKKFTSSTSYKVVRIPELGVSPTTNFDLEIFSSETGEWNTYKVSCPQEVSKLYYSITNHVVIQNGVLYWLERRNRILVYDLSNNNNNKTAGGCCRLINLPENKESFYRCLGMSEGFICYCQCNNGQFSVWVLEDCSIRGSVWCLIHKINLEDMLLPENCDGQFIIKDLGSGGLVNLKPLAFNPVDRNVVIFAFLRSFQASLIFAYNIKTKRIKELITNHNLLYFCSRIEDMSSFVLSPWPTSL
ncbi:F-box domain [Macleaya cordata]|uniref:F-box domain n=1 Tax=Macleaya cordata TaxID=56857 RepID=A0A200QEP5_MACCD|nr:F-box domain [Macleaya cordata]